LGAKLFNLVHLCCCGGYCCYVVLVHMWNWK